MTTTITGTATTSGGYCTITLSLDGETRESTVDLGFTSAVRFGAWASGFVSFAWGIDVEWVVDSCEADKIVLDVLQDDERAAIDKADEAEYVDDSEDWVPQDPADWE